MGNRHVYIHACLGLGAACKPPPHVRHVADFEVCLVPLRVERCGARGVNNVWAIMKTQFNTHLPYGSVKEINIS